MFDDTVQEKAWTDESDFMSRHYDYYSVPFAFEVIRKSHLFCQVMTHRVKRTSVVTKKELIRAMIATSAMNAIKFRTELTDSWFDTKENFEVILKKGKHFISALKDNRLVVLNEED